MVCLSGCDYCSATITHHGLCTSCKSIVATEALAGRPIDKDSIKAISDKKSLERNDLEMKKHMNSMARQSCIDEALKNFKVPYPEAETRF